MRDIKMDTSGEERGREETSGEKRGREEGWKHFGYIKLHVFCF